MVSRYRPDYIPQVKRTGGGVEACTELLDKLLQPRGRANQLHSISGPWLNHASKVQWLTIDKHVKARKDKVENGTYGTCVGVYCLLGSISQPSSSTFFNKSKVDRTDAAASVIVEWARCLPGQALPGWQWYIDMWEEFKQCPPPTKSKWDVHRVSNGTVKLPIPQKTLGSELARFWVVPFVIQHCPMVYHLRNREGSTFKGGKWLLPLVGDHNRVGGDMIVTVEIVTGRPMYDTWTR